MVIIHHHLVHLTSTIAIHHQFKDQMVDHFIQTYQNQQRHRRFITLFDNTKNDKHYQSGNNSPVIVSDGQQSGSVTSKDLLDTLEHQANRVVEGATNVVLTPVNWIAHITHYWPLYIICATIIFGLIVFIYCSCQHKWTNLTSNHNYDPLAMMNLFWQQRQNNLSTIN